MSDEIEKVGEVFRANALSAQLFDSSCIIIRHTFPSERKTMVDVGEPFFRQILTSIAKLSHCGFERFSYNFVLFYNKALASNVICCFHSVFS